VTLSRRKFVGLAAAGALVTGADAAPWSWLVPEPPAAGGWDRVEPLPWSTQEVYATVHDGRIVVTGGLRSGPESSRRFETLRGTALFGPRTGAWRPGPDLPQPRHHLVLAGVRDAVYGFGGFVGESLRDGFRFRRDVFTLRDGAWRRTDRMPVPLGETVAATLGARVHLATGSLHSEGGTVRTETRRHLVYDPEEESWTTARPVPTTWWAGVVGRAGSRTSARWSATIRTRTGGRDFVLSRLPPVDSPPRRSTGIWSASAGSDSARTAA